MLLLLLFGWGNGEAVLLLVGNSDFAVEVDNKLDSGGSGDLGRAAMGRRGDCSHCCFLCWNHFNDPRVNGVVLPVVASFTGVTSSITSLLIVLKEPINRTYL